MTTSADLKRLIDVVVSAAALVALAPVSAVIAILICRDSPGPVLYRQLRRGRGDATFVMLKFRTMGMDAEARLSEVLGHNMHATELGDDRMYKIADDPRVTRLGRFLRRHSLDELPQLLNVLSGDMSLVGPRPLTLAEDVHVTGNATVRRSVRPGITGPWQVAGRNAIPFERMLELDCEYARRRTLIADLAIVLRTLPVVVRAQRPC